MSISFSIITKFLKFKAMVKILTPKSFIECWEAFVKENNEVLLSVYDSDREWTKTVIGKGESKINEDSPFGKFFKKWFGNEYSYRKENGSIDLSIYKSEFLKGVMDMNPDGQTNDLNKEVPKFYDVFLSTKTI